MAVNLTINGVVFAYPEQGDQPPWGGEATGWATAVTGGMLQKAGGTFTLLAETDFGPSAGIKALYLKSRTANLANAGMIRLAPSDIIAWRDNGNTIDLTLGINGSDQLTFNAVPIQVGQVTNADVAPGAGIVYSKLDLSDSIVNADVNTAAAIARSKLADGTASRALETDGSGIITDSAITSTELNNISGSTSNIQTQLDAVNNQTLFSSDTLALGNLGTTLQTVVLNSLTGKNVLIFAAINLNWIADGSGRLEIDYTVKNNGLQVPMALCRINVDAYDPAYLSRSTFHIISVDISVSVGVNTYTLIEDINKGTKAGPGDDSILIIKEF